MDWSLLHAFNNFLARHDGVEDPLIAYVQAAEVVFAALIAALFLLSRGTTRTALRRAAVAAGAGAAVALAIGQVISHLVDRARPFVDEPGRVHLFAAHAADAGFPSDHATAGFAIAVAILLRHRGWGITALVMATVLAAGRVGMGVHFPSDVLGGAALGSATSLALWVSPLRRRLDVLADWAGAVWDGMVGRAEALVR